MNSYGLENARSRARTNTHTHTHKTVGSESIVIHIIGTKLFLVRLDINKKMKIHLLHSSAAAHEHCEWKRTLSKRLTGTMVLHRYLIPSKFFVQPTTKNNPCIHFSKLYKVECPSFDFVRINCHLFLKKISLCFFEKNWFQLCTQKPSSSGPIQFLCGYWTAVDILTYADSSLYGLSVFFLFSSSLFAYIFLSRI